MATPTLERPAQNPDNNKDRKFGGKKLIATIALGAGAVGLWTYNSVNNDINDNVKTIQDRTQQNYQEEMAERGHGDIYNGDPVVIEAPRTVSYPTESVATGEMAELLAEYNKFDGFRQSTLETLIRNNVLTPDEVTFLSTHLATLSQKADKSDYTDNEVLTAVALDSALVSLQEPNIGNSGADLLPLVLNKDSASFDQELATVVGDSKTFIPTYKQEGAPLQRPKGTTFLGKEFGNVKDVRIIVKTNLPSPHQTESDVFTEVGVYVLNNDGQGNELWQLYERYGLEDDPRVSQEVQSLR